MVVRIRRVTVWGFRSFVERTSFEFPDSGMVLVKGSNLDTKGSSGAGKTTVLLAIAYALGYCQFPATELQSWHTDEAMGVEVEFESNAGIVTLTRGSKLSIKVGSTLYTSAKTVEAKIKELVGLDIALLEALTYRRQKQAGVFLTKRNSEKLEFLTLLLDLGKHEEEIEFASKCVKGAEVDAASATAVAKQWESQVKAQEQSLTEVVLEDEVLLAQVASTAEVVQRNTEREVVLYTDAYAAALKDERQRAEEARLAFKDDLLVADAALKETQGGEPFVFDEAPLQKVQADLTELRVRLNALREADGVRLTEQRSALRLIEADIHTHRACVALAANAERDRRALLAQLAELERNACPTCKRTWDEAMAQIQAVREGISKLEADIENSKLSQQAVADLEAKAEPLRSFTPDPKIARYVEVEQKLAGDVLLLQQHKSMARTMYDAQRKQREAEARERLTSLTSQAREAAARVLDAPDRPSVFAKSKLEQAERDASDAKAAAMAAVAKLSSARSNNELRKSVREREEQRLDVIRQNLANAREQEEQAVTEVAKWRDYHELHKSFLQSIFDEVLQEISDEANNILAGLPNTRHCTIEFKSESVTQKGGVKNEILPVITIGGKAAPIKSGCSGGMETAVDLAVDIAIGEVVRRRTGCYPGWLILDEAFTGLDSVTKESCLEILQQYASDRLVLVVDHCPEFKEMFRYSIEVKFVDGISKLVA